MFLSQSGTLNTPASAALMAAREAQFGEAYVAALTAAVVPEPASLGVLGLAGVGLLGRHARRRRPSGAAAPE